VKKKQANRHLKSTSVTTEDAWATAVADGCDMNLLELSLRKTPAERIDANQGALNLVEALQAASRRRNGKS
jgi:hypothetical protein